jgi:hypothetical protein
MWFNSQLRHQLEWVMGYLSFGLKEPSHEADSTPPSSPRIENEWSYISVPPLCLHRVHKDNFTFFLSWRHYLYVIPIRNGMNDFHCVVKQAWYAQDKLDFL